MSKTDLRTISFPPDRSMGVLYLRDIASPEDWDEWAEARGEVIVPSGRNVRLSVSYEAMSDLTPLSTLKADDLQVLEITCSGKFADAQLKNISGLTGLEGLALWETDTGDAAFFYLSRMSNLLWLDIGDTKVTDEGLAFVRCMPRLEELTLLNTQIGNAALRHLEGLDGLKRLDLMGTKVNDAASDLLNRLTGLEYLRITDTAITPPIYSELKRALPTCQITY